MPRIIRVFRAKTKPGAETQFREFFVEVAEEIRRAHPGCESIEIGFPMEDSPLEFLMISRWTDLDAVRGFAGETWREPVIDDREAALLDETFLDHYVERG